jgi:hypothetical protein
LWSAVAAVAALVHWVQVVAAVVAKSARTPVLRSRQEHRFQSPSVLGVPEQPQVRAQPVVYQSSGRIRTCSVGQAAQQVLLQMAVLAAPVAPRRVDREPASTAVAAVPVQVPTVEPPVRVVRRLPTTAVTAVPAPLPLVGLLTVGVAVADIPAQPPLAANQVPVAAAAEAGTA